MIKQRDLLPLLACVVVLWTVNCASDEQSNSEGVCYQPELSQYSDLFRKAFAVKLGGGVQVFINCMSFNESRELETAVVSGGRNKSDAEGAVFTFKCVGSTLIAFESNRTFSEGENRSCLECDTSSTNRDACVTRKLDHYLHVK